MRETDDKLEAELASLAPSAPSETLMEQIGRELSDEKTPETSFLSWGKIATFGVLAAAACLAIVLNFPESPEIAEERQIEVAQSKRIETEYLAPSMKDVEQVVKGFEAVDRFREVLAAEQSPVFFLDNGQPAQGVYVRYLDTVVMENMDTRASVMIASPREEYRVVPVVTY